ncbi:MAG TPA: rhomboid family intramembrane serine protease [Armatimonadota bacterium]|nr:rhomboid family intramembrane serine protease [Armatimonadota bacterium]
MLLPVQVESGRSRLPRATLSLLLVTTLIYALCVAQGLYEHGMSLTGVRSIPDSVLAFWALYPAHPHPWSFLTAPWIHLNILHLGGNLLFLWVFGAAAEDALGTPAAIGIYLAGGIASTLAQYLVAVFNLAPDNIYYGGASGAVIALIAAFAIRRYRARVRLWFVAMEISLPVGLSLTAFLCWYGLVPWLIASPDSPPGYWGHLGAGAAGLTLALALRLGPRGIVEYSVEDAVRLIAKGNLREGLHDLRLLQRIAPLDSRIPLALAQAYLSIWDMAEAGRAYAHAVQIELDLRQPARAFAIWQEAAGRQVTIPARLVVTLASALLKEGNQQPAVELYRWAAAQEECAAAAASARRRLASMGLDA